MIILRRFETTCAKRGGAGVRVSNGRASFGVASGWLWGVGFGVLDLGCWLWGVGFGVLALGCWLWGVGSAGWMTVGKEG
eukprot:5719655-Prymnesium_polylepis.2